MKFRVWSSEVRVAFPVVKTLRLIQPTWEFIICLRMNAFHSSKSNSDH